jgi:hypothetical protein
MVSTPISAMALPSWLTVSPAQNKRKSRCRNSPPMVMLRGLPRPQLPQAAICRQQRPG